MNPSATAQPFVFAPPSGGVATAAPESLVDQTRREISDILREVALESRRQQPRRDFLRLVADRTLRAMAAEGVVVWQRTSRLGDASSTASFHAAVRLGTITDQTIPSESFPVQKRLLQQIAMDGQPVVVPPTPGATDPDVPANVTSVPTALVPISLIDADQTDTILQVFLEPDGGITTQRGYLRFAAQIADLAGEFLRAELTRSLQLRVRLDRRIDAICQSLHERLTPQAITDQLADSVAETFGFDRVVVCHRDEDRTQVLSASHIETVDTRSESAQAITQLVASMPPLSGGCHWLDDLAADSRVDDTVWPAMDDDLTPILFALSRPSGIRLIGLQRHDLDTDQASAAAIDALDRDIQGQAITRLVEHAELALVRANPAKSVSTKQRISRWLLLEKANEARPWKQRLRGIAALTLVAVVAFFPTPMRIRNTGTLLASERQPVYAHRSAIVAEIHVQHRQQVESGDLLVTLKAPDLDEQIARLMGQQAVLQQQLQRSTNDLIRSQPSAGPSTQRQDEQTLVNEQLRGIEVQLAVLRKQQQSLSLRADRSGRVEAWQLRQRLLGRPLKRGDAILEVITPDTAWHVDGTIPHSRVESLRAADASGDLTVTCTPSESGAELYQAQLVQIGPSLPATAQEPARVAVRLRLATDDRGDIRFQPGQPVRTLFHCGHAPLAYVVFQDVLRHVHGYLKLTFASMTPIGEQP
ncbi:MAG: HlyD family efflux transporter periplasmic adaptor subunit [Planctomycetota bacterium]